MSVFRGVVVALLSALLMVSLSACQAALANVVPPAFGRPALSTATELQTLPASGNVVWARVPYCDCLAGSATANVANALKNAELAVTLKEQSPHDGWLYFVASFDSDSATRDQIAAAVKTGGGQVVEGPP